jgi:hypothetical protein
MKSFKKFILDGFKKGETVVHEGTRLTVAIPDAGNGKIGVCLEGHEHIRGAVSFVSASKLRSLKESLHYYGGQYTISHEDDPNDAVNVADNRAKYNVFDLHREVKDIEDNVPKYKPSKEIIAILEKDIKETTERLGDRQEVLDYDWILHHRKLNALVRLRDYIIEGTDDSLKRAANLLVGLMSNISTKISEDVLKYIACGGQNRSLSGYQFAVKEGYKSKHDWIALLQEVANREQLTDEDYEAAYGKLQRNEMTKEQINSFATFLADKGEARSIESAKFIINRMHILLHGAVPEGETAQRAETMFKIPKTMINFILKKGVLDMDDINEHIGLAKKDIAERAAAANKKLNRKDATQAMADFYRKNSDKIKTSAKKAREQIINMIMKGSTPEQAFSTHFKK